MENKFLSLLFLVRKKNGGNCPIISLKDLNKSVPYANFKMEGIFLLKELLMPGDLRKVQNIHKGRLFCSSIPLVKM